MCTSKIEKKKSNQIMINITIMYYTYIFKIQEHMNVLKIWRNEYHHMNLRTYMEERLKFHQLVENLTLKNVVWPYKNLFYLKEDQIDF